MNKVTSSYVECSSAISPMSIPLSTSNSSELPCLDLVSIENVMRARKSRIFSLESNYITEAKVSATMRRSRRLGYTIYRTLTPRSHYCPLTWYTNTLWSVLASLVFINHLRSDMPQERFKAV